MSATVWDVVSEYRRRIAGLPLEDAFMFYDWAQGRTILFTTFFEQIDHPTEDMLANIEGEMVDAFSEYLLDFRTIHLMGRDLRQFIPTGAVPLRPVRRSEPQSPAR